MLFWGVRDIFPKLSLITNDNDEITEQLPVSGQVKVLSLSNRSPNPTRSAEADGPRLWVQHREGTPPHFEGEGSLCKALASYAPGHRDPATKPPTAGAGAAFDNDSQFSGDALLLGS